MLVHKCGQIKNWGGECRDVTLTKLQSQNIYTGGFNSPKFQSRFPFSVCSGVFINTTHAIVDTRFQLHFFNALTKAKAESA